MNNQSDKFIKWLEEGISRVRLFVESNKEIIDKETLTMYQYRFQEYEYILKMYKRFKENRHPFKIEQNMLTKEEFIEKIDIIRITSGGVFSDSLLATAYDKDGICLISGKKYGDHCIDDGSYVEFCENFEFDLRNDVRTMAYKIIYSIEDILYDGYKNYNKENI